MDKKIIFIHKSAILAKGLYSILNPSYGIDLIHLSCIDEIDNYCDIDKSFILFIIDVNLSKEIDKLSLLSENNEFDLLWFNNCELDDNDSLYAFSSIEEVKSIVCRILTKHNLYVEEKNCTKELSDRELDVLKLVAKGFSNRDIGEQLFISIHTVISHRKNITDKLGIKSISGLTVYAILNKLVDAVDIS